MIKTIQGITVYLTSGVRYVYDNEPLNGEAELVYQITNNDKTVYCASCRLGLAFATSPEAAEEMITDLINRAQNAR